MTLKPKTQDLAAERREARLLYPLYSALGREFVIELSSCPDLESGLEDPLQESVEQARQWLLEMDQKIQALTPAQISDAFRRHVDAGSISIVKAGAFKAAAVYQ